LPIGSDIVVEARAWSRGQILWPWPLDLVALVSKVQALRTALTIFSTTVELEIIN